MATDPFSDPPSAISPPPANDNLAQPRPTLTSERIEAIDVLRGLVLLGILLINIIGFGLPHWAMWNPTVAGGHTGVDWWAWFGAEVLVEGKMRALFSMLFGAGVILMTQRAEASGPEGRARIADIYYRRMLWLIVFGLINAYVLLFPGDILYDYAVIGLLLFPLRKLRARTLLIAGLCVIFVEIGYNLIERESRIEKREEALIARALQNEGKEVTDEQRETLKEWDERLKENSPTAREIEGQLSMRRGGYSGMFVGQAGTVKELHSWPLYLGGDFLSMMLIGMGLVRSGVIIGRRSKRYYFILAVVCLPLCWTIAGIARLAWSGAGFDPAFIAPLYASSSWTYPVQRLLGALGYLGAVMLFARTLSLHKLTRAIAITGRIPLTNYLGQSVICLVLFSGVGFGLVGELHRYQLLLVAIAIWIVQVLFSVAWLRQWSFGPMEWLWRWLSYGQRPPLLKG